MYTLILLCALSVVSRAISEPIPVVHDRIIRRCENHTSTSWSSYGYSKGSTGLPTTLVIPLPGTVSSSISNDTTANELGTSTDTAAPSSTTSVPAGLSFPGSAPNTGSASAYNRTGSTVTVTETLSSNATGFSSSTCSGSVCSIFPTNSNAVPPVAPSTTLTYNPWEGPSTIVINKTSTSTATSLSPASASGTVGLPGSSLASALNTSSTVPIANTSIVASATGNFSISPPTSSAACYGYECPPPYVNVTASVSSSESISAGAVGTTNATTAAPAPTTSDYPSIEQTTVTIFVTPIGAPGSSSFDSSWPTPVSFTNASYSGSSYSVSSTSTAGTTPAATTSPASTDLSPFNTFTSSPSSIDVPALVNATTPCLWCDWLPPTSPLPTTFVTSFASAGNSTASPTGGFSGLNATNSLAKVEAEVDDLASDSRRSLKGKR